jgi:hypothetical protein
MTHSDYKIIFNVDNAGNYKNFSYHYEGDNSYTGNHYVIDVDNTGCLFIGTSDINFNSVADGFYNHSYSSSGEEPHFSDGGIRLTKDTMQNLEKISIDDGYYVTSTSLNIARQAVATWLVNNGGYADVQAACSVNNTTTAQSNLTAIIQVINDNLNWTV